MALTYLGKMGILEKDLIPIILLNSPADNSTKERLVLACSKQKIQRNIEECELLTPNYVMIINGVSHPFS